MTPMHNSHSRSAATCLTLTVLSASCGTPTPVTETKTAIPSSNAAAGQQPDKPASDVTLAEESALRIAKKKPLPEYPPSAAAARTEGQVIAKIVTSPDGVVRVVEILESTNHDFAHSVRDALRWWELRPVTITGAKAPSSATITMGFYFRIVDGAPRVYSATEFGAKHGKP
jgi:TonB family protein